MREVDIINYLIDLDPELKASYDLYHYVRHCVKHKQFELLKKAFSEKEKECFQLYENRHPNDE